MINLDDTYYLFNTGTGITNWSSEDMINWEQLDPIYDSATEWTVAVVPGFENCVT